MTDTTFERTGRCGIGGCSSAAVSTVELPFADGPRPVDLCGFHHDWVQRRGDQGAPVPRGRAPRRGLRGASQQKWS